MPKDYIWIEELFNRIPVPYPFVSLIAATAIYLIFEVFSINVGIFHLSDPTYAIPISAASILIAYQLAGIRYLLNDIRKIFGTLSPLRDNNSYLGNVHKRLEESNLYYITIFFVIAIFMMIDLMHINCQLGNPLAQYSCSYNRGSICGGYMFFTAPCDFSRPNVLIHSWNFGLDVYKYIVSYLGYYLFGVILWVIFAVSQILGDLSGNFHGNKINVNIFHVDKIGGLKPLLDFVVKASCYYLICIAIMIVSSYSPVEPVPQETIALFLLLFIGLGFFFSGKAAVQSIFTQEIQLELDNINQEYQKQENRLKDLLSKDRIGKPQSNEQNAKSQEELNFISNSLEQLNKERDRLLRINTNVINIRTLIPLISSVLTTLVAILGKYQELQSHLKGLLPPHLFG